MWECATKCKVFGDSTCLVRHSLRSCISQKSQMFAKSGCGEKCSVRCIKEQGVSLRLTHNTSTPQPSHNRILSGRVLSRMSGPFPWMTYLLFWCWLIGAVIPSGRVWGAVSNQPGDNWSHHDSSNALSTGQGHPIKPISQTLWTSPDTLIFVGIVAYRDPRCATTLSYLLSRAKYPDRIRIGTSFFFFSLNFCQIFTFGAFVDFLF